MVFYKGAMFPEWNGSLLIGGLATNTLSRIKFENGNPTPAERWDVGKHIRDVAVAPDGAVWLIEDSRTGGVFRVTPKKN
jgi:glucose/arabinose dehydrogenase